MRARTTEAAGRRRIAAIALGAAAALSVPAGRAEAQRRLEPASAHFWEGAAATIALAAVLDRPVRVAARTRDGSAGLDDAARVGDALGTANHLVPALALSYVAARATRRSRWARATLHVAAGYAAADLVTSALKPAVGRERPHVSGRPGRFHPFTKDGDYHAFPSGHVTHAAAIAAGVVEYAGGRRWVAPFCYGVVGLVGWQRVYADQHWASDVAAGAVVGLAASKTVVRWLERRAAAGSGDRSGWARLELLPLLAGPGRDVGVVLSIAR